MRMALLGILFVVAAVQADKRYDIESDLKTYPQGTPKEALASVLKALEGKRVDYLLAHLADPQFVDQRVKENGGSFKELVKEATGKLVDDPSALKQLRRFLSDGEWKTEENSATVQLKDAGGRQVFLRKIGGRWFMENRRAADTPKSKEP